MLRVLLCSTLILSTACAYVPTTRIDYAPARPPVTNASNLTLAVVPFEEARPPRHMPGLQGRLFATYIPLLPFIKIPYERIDEHYSLAMKGSAEATGELFPVGMARAIAHDLAQSGLFREVRFAENRAEAAGADLILSGRLNSTEFDVYATSYMLGIAGVLLWLLPIPIGSNAATVEADLVLSDASGAELWRHPLEGDASRMFTLYNSAGGAVSSPYRLEVKRYGSNDEGVDPDSLWAYHAAALREAMGSARDSLTQFLASYGKMSEP